ncbi:zinc finger protein 703 [Boleophthalmus pectinirostris]|uniref:zinc finger protein 703 n=1 Tax=Boleophthalmus pectinirostris TaxID=150288 RepID=UPI000A1C72CB|nr:zinc finger protein 703 [Boleophthalmus pectinirostris]
MRDLPCGSEAADALFRSLSPERSAEPERTGPCLSASAPPLSPSDPSRQAKRLPIRIVKMLTAHSGHLLHPEYLQPLTSAPVSIELDAKKSPLALLAQTCSQIGKPDPPSSSKLSSLSSGSLGDKESSSRSKSGEQHHSPEDKSSFKPYSKSSGESRKDVIVTKSSSEKSFRLPNGSNNSSSASCPSFPPHARSPGSHSPPLHVQSLRQSQSPAARSPTHPQSQHSDRTPPSSEQPASDSSNSSGGKKDSDTSKSGLDGAQLANSSHVRASANSSNASSASSPRPESKSDPQASSQPGLGSGHIAPVSPFKPGHSVFPLPPASMGYHGSVIGAYAGYPSQFVPSLDPTKSSLGLGLPGKHPSSSPLTGASPPSLMQGLCRDPYCLTYPNGHHLGGSNCNSCVHDPSSMKSSFPLVYPSHHLHSLHSGALSSSSTPGSLSHPLYTYGFMLPNDPLPHACNWVSVGGPCDKRFATSEELLAHLRTHTALPGMVDSKMLSAYPSSVSSSASCHLHLPPPSSPGTLPSSFSLRGSPGLGLARYHPYSKSHLPAPGLPMPSIPSSSPYYSPYALYSQRLGSASALGYQ